MNSQGILGVFAIPHYELAPLLERHDTTLLVLDNIREPGNLARVLAGDGTATTVGIQDLAA